MSEISTKSRAFLDRVHRRIEKTAPQTARGSSDETGFPALLVAAAVQHVFTLPSLGGTPDAALLRRLVTDSVPAPGFLDRQGRILSRSLRRQILHRIGAEGILSVLAGLTPIATLTQTMFQSLLDGRGVDLGRLSRDELVALYEAAGWLEGIVALPFTAREVEQALMRSEIWAPLSAMLGGALVGRDGDLADLAAFAGVRLDRDGGVSPAAGTPARIALVEGVGGIGKTALIAHFLLRLNGQDGSPRLPFAYLPCDDPGLDVTDTDLLLTICAQQILRQVRLAAGGADLAGVEDAHAAFMDSVRRQAGTVEAATKRSSTADSLDMRLGEIRAGSASVATDFAGFADLASGALARAGRGWQPPCLIVIDTFEEVQYRSSARMLAFWQLIGQLLTQSRHIRILIAGRAPLADPDLPVQVIRLGLRDLSHPAAVDLLMRESGRGGPELDRLARQIGGNPLNLRLAARVIADEEPGRRGIEGLSTRRWGFLRVSEELIRGQLYRRVLDHIHDPRVRALAHPGMILRRVTPQIIAEVLADVCEIEIDGPEDAQALFEELAREHTLVRRDEDGSLCYREDVRRPVLRLLTADQPQLTRTAHAAAHRFHAARGDPASVAEAIYHGLMLGMDAVVLDDLWVAAAAPYLTGAVEDLPPEAVVWLAGRMDIHLTDDQHRAASLAEWERITGPRALAVLQQSGSIEVLAMLSRRKERSVQSPLISIEARCLISLGDHDAAQALLDRALRDSPVAGNAGRKAEYLWLLAKSLWESGRGDDALATLDDLASVAATLGSALPMVQCLTARLALAPAAEAGSEDRRAALAAALSRCTEAEMAQEGDVIRRGFAHLDPAAAGRLTRCALASLSGLFAIVTEGTGFSPSEAHLAPIRDLAATAATLPGEDGFGSRMTATLTRRPVDTEQLVEAMQILRRPLARAADGRTDAVAAVAAQMVWHLVQMETATLATATLAGIDAYRMPWEVETEYLAATA